MFLSDTFRLRPSNPCLVTLPFQIAELEPSHSHHLVSGIKIERKYKNLPVIASGFLTLDNKL